MPKLRIFGPPEEGMYAFHCPAGHQHVITTKRLEGFKGKYNEWKFNEDLNCPSFSPSIMVKCGKYVDPTADPENVCSYQCHFWIKNGNIEFDPDCSHEFAGKKMELPEITEAE